VSPKIDQRFEPPDVLQQRPKGLPFQKPDVPTTPFQKSGDSMDLTRLQTTVITNQSIVITRLANRLEELEKRVEVLEKNAKGGK
jgi:hypothetical protein